MMRPSPDTDANLAAFLRVLDPEDNSTGGGTASAVAGAMAAALTAMVARLSPGKPEPESFYAPIRQEASQLAASLFQGGRLDSEAFDAVLRSVRLPKGTEAQQAARNLAIQAGYARATEAPLHNAELCVRTYQLAGELQGRSNPNAASDLTSARLLAWAGALGCLANVRINLSSIKDPERAAHYAARADMLAAAVQE